MRHHMSPFHFIFTHFLQRLRAGSPATANETVQEEDAVWISNEEVATLTQEQQAFVIRKRKAAAGQGPVMPLESMYVRLPACNLLLAPSLKPPVSITTCSPA